MKTYHLTSFWKYYCVLTGPTLFWAILGAAAYQGKYLDFVFLASMLGLADMTLGLYSAPTSHIVVSEEGVMWHSPGFTLWARWENLEKISHRFYGFSIQEGLAGTKPMVRINNTGIGFLPTPWQLPPVKPFIPLSCFVDNWRNSELGRQIKQYAPHLFQ